MGRRVSAESKYRNAGDREAVLRGADGSPLLWVVGSLLYGMAWLTGRSFLEVLGNLWIPPLFTFVGTIFSAFKIANEEDSA